MERKLTYRDSFYPGTVEKIDEFIKENSSKKQSIENLKGLILPHAGWIYSGKTALAGLSRLPVESIDTIFLIGPSHRVPFIGVALPGFTTYETVGGSIPLNRKIINELLQFEGVDILDEPHIYEHSLEVELEFINHYYPDINLVPVVAGSNSQKPLKKILRKSLNRPGALTIISSDLSHYEPYKEAVKHDTATIESLIAGKEFISGDSACGSVIINTLLDLNSNKQFTIRLIEYCNSGDTAGTKDGVVGYAAMEIINNG